MSAKTSSITRFSQSKTVSIGSFFAVLYFSWLLGGFWSVMVLMGVLLVVAGHELGHLIAARITGCVASDFSVGFGPVIWQYKGKRNWWRLRSIPLGGFVRLDPLEEDGFTGPKMSEMSPGARFFLAVSGPLGSIASAIALGIIAISAVGVTFSGNTITTDTDTLRSGDVVVAIDGVPANVDAGNNMLVVEGETLDLTVLRGEEQLDVAISSGELSEVALQPVTVRPNPLEGAQHSWNMVVTTTTSAVDGMANFPRAFYNLVFGDVQDEYRPTSVVGVMKFGEATNDAYGLSGILLLVAQLSVALGLVNMLPIPPLDGGHALQAAVEGTASTVTRRKVRLSEKAMNFAGVAFFILLTVVGLTVMVFDVISPIVLPE